MSYGLDSIPALPGPDVYVNDLKQALGGLDDTANITGSRCRQST
jgi:hypothetical protein